MVAIVVAVVAFKMGRKCLKYIKAVSDPLSYGHTHMPSPQGPKEKATDQATLVLVSHPVRNNVDSTAPGVVCDMAATVAVTRCRPKVANKPRASYTPAHLKQVEAEWVKRDWEQYELLKACRLKNSGCKWYNHAYNTATPQWLNPTAT